MKTIYIYISLLSSTSIYLCHLSSLVPRTPLTSLLPSPTPSVETPIDTRRVKKNPKPTDRIKLIRNGEHREREALNKTRDIYPLLVINSSLSEESQSSVLRPPPKWPYSTVLDNAYNDDLSGVSSIFSLSEVFYGNRTMINTKEKCRYGYVGIQRGRRRGGGVVRFQEIQKNASLSNIVPCLPTPSPPVIRTDSN